MKRSQPGTYKTYKQAAKRTKTYTPRPQAYIPAGRMAMTETKYFDTSFSQTVSSAADWTGSEVPCTNYLNADGATLSAYTDSALIPSAIGAGYGQVNGSKYYLKKLRIRGNVLATASSDQVDVPAGASTRIIVVMDTQPKGTQAQGEDIFTDMGTAVQGNFSFLAMAAGSGGRFRILKDKEFFQQPVIAGTDGANTVSVNRTGFNFKFNIDFKKPVQVMLKANASTPAVASLSNTNIFLIAHTTSGTCPANIGGCARAYYQD
nr:MAG: putative capsid protein [Arizlama virus]